MWMMVRQREADDYVVAAGGTHAVRECIERAFAVVGRRIEWQGKGTDEQGIDAKTGNTLVRVDARYFRPAEVDLLVGDPTKAREKLGWKHTISFDDLVTEMVVCDLRELQSEHRQHDNSQSRTVSAPWQESVGRRAPGYGGLGNGKAAGIRIL